jgi:hypothetical protein
MLNAEALEAREDDRRERTREMIDESARAAVVVFDARRGRVCMAKRVRGVERAERGEGEAIRGRGEIRRRGEERRSA